MKASAGHARPPSSGFWAISRRRMWLPPPHETVHWLQELQSPILQSAIPHDGCSGQGRVSPSGSRQPAPPSPRVRMISRALDCMPAPQGAEHVLHSDQPDIWQSRTAQGPTLHPLVWISSTGHRFPPCFGKVRISRCRRACPAPQVLSHCSHDVQSEISQSTAVEPQDSVRRSTPPQGSPPPEAMRTTDRRRSRCIAAPHGDHGFHSPMMQSTFGGTTQSCSEHAISCRSVPEHCSPPFSDVCSTPRSRIFRPWPHVRLQLVHGCQGSKAQGCGSGMLHARVSFRFFGHAAPSSFGSCRTSRERYLWPSSWASHADHAVHEDSTQSCEPSHAASHGLVSRRWPSHGSPHSLFISVMMRWRSQRPMHGIGLQSLQAANPQSLGTQASWQSGPTGQACVESCVPRQCVPSAALNSEPSTAPACSRSSRLRMVVC
mmetsp:Transcript_97047/g.296604  ORF Transcript_97047/g.296604 Transcript_97047/m.296604 type:complete len:432 (+) Transcript_97047:893-2188(+)